MLGLAQAAVVWIVLLAGTVKFNIQILLPMAWLHLLQLVERLCAITPRSCGSQQQDLVVERAGSHIFPEASVIIGSVSTATPAVTQMATLRRTFLRQSVVSQSAEGHRQMCLSLSSKRPQPPPRPPPQLWLQQQPQPRS